MKSYPSIPSAVGTSFFAFEAHVFDKLDGSNLRFEWSKKKGWYKFGTRTRLFDHTDPVFASAIPLWQTTTGLALEKIAVNKKWDSMLAFAEFWGPSSFAGLHDLNEPHRLSIFDIAINKGGIVGPVQFLKLCGDLDIPRYLGKCNWTRDYVASVKSGAVEGITFEGVVGKAGEGHKLIRAKAKTQRWIDAVHGKFDAAQAASILN